MNRPEGISPEVWSKAVDLVMDAKAERVPYYSTSEEIREARLADATAIALAIQSSVEAERAVIRVQVLEAIEPYTRVSTLHNYGPGGLSRVEEAEIRTGTFIQEDILALFERLSKGA